jgi:exosortase F-associated protein
MKTKIWLRFAFLFFGLIGFLTAYFFQRFDASGVLLNVHEKQVNFVINRTLRFVLNDACGLLIISGLFYERKYVLVTLWVQVTGFVAFLIPYFLLRFNWPEYSGPLYSALHRLVLNPTLTLLLIPAFYAHRKREF